MPGNGYGVLLAGKCLTEEIGTSSVFFSIDEALMFGYAYDCKACRQVIAVVTIPSMDAEVESAMTSPHWRRLFVSA
jgi:hypothetical protein